MTRPMRAPAPQALVRSPLTGDDGTARVEHARIVDHELGRAIRDVDSNLDGIEDAGGSDGESVQSGVEVGGGPEGRGGGLAVPGVGLRVELDGECGAVDPAAVEPGG